MVHISLTLAPEGQEEVQPSLTPPAVSLDEERRLRSELNDAAYEVQVAPPAIVSFPQRGDGGADEQALLRADSYAQRVDFIMQNSPSTRELLSDIEDTLRSHRELRADTVAHQPFRVVVVVDGDAPLDSSAPLGFTSLRERYPFPLSGSGEVVPRHLAVAVINFRNIDFASSILAQDSTDTGGGYFPPLLAPGIINNELADVYHGLGTVVEGLEAGLSPSLVFPLAQLDLEHPVREALIYAIMTYLNDEALLQNREWESLPWPLVEQTSMGALREVALRNIDERVAGGGAAAVAAELNRLVGEYIPAYTAERADLVVIEMDVAEDSDSLPERMTLRGQWSSATVEDQEIPPFFVSEERGALARAFGEAAVEDLAHGYSLRNPYLGGPEGLAERVVHSVDHYLAAHGLEALQVDPEVLSIPLLPGAEPRFFRVRDEQPVD